MDVTKIPTEILVEELKKRLLSAEQAAIYISTHISYIWKLVGSNRLTPVDFFNRRLFEREELDRELESRQARELQILANRAVQVDRSPPSCPYEGWTIRDLQWECKRRELRVRGHKVDLVARLIEHDKQVSS